MISFLVTELEYSSSLGTLIWVKVFHVNVTTRPGLE